MEELLELRHDNSMNKRGRRVLSEQSVFASGDDGRYVCN
jgi:hypothetical protein